MLIRFTLVCAAVAVLSACSAVAPVSGADNTTHTAATVKYPSEYNQFRELGWDFPAANAAH